MKLIVTGSYEESSRIAADMFEEVIINKKNPLLGCATGSTPIGLYQCLTEDYRAGKIDFSGVRTINLDEYAGLTKSHSQSFGYFMEQHLFSKVNIKKENIGLIEVMGLAVLPARLKEELEILKECLLGKKNILEISNMQKHVAWYNELKSHDFNEDTVDQLLKEELTHKFVNVLEDAGVFKMNEEGKEAFIKFVEMVGEK